MGPRKYVLWTSAAENAAAIQFPDVIIVHCLPGFSTSVKSGFPVVHLFYLAVWGSSGAYLIQRNPVICRSAVEKIEHVIHWFVKLLKDDICPTFEVSLQMHVIFHKRTLFKSVTPFTMSYFSDQQMTRQGATSLYLCL